ncbi:cysteine hydrolase [Asanoa sp. WMMD1127]|uniref:isochorismatase family cysteine hydrolase n=1 Tax=Asanoa sp. WMMD1127 TaxID=3016107 RepID=UPI002417518B|nr:isochorismatase family cysteine hydrolase [Asanoa sp. WMMD1127]MDG4823725.1 cysteine hydrolase [Asanoa sp. WMMD1127]
MERKMHDWRIEEREYQRHEARRGRRHAFTSLEPARTALVVVDMVPFFVEENDYTFGIVPNISRLAEATRQTGGTVAWVVPGFTEPSAVKKEFYRPRTAEMFARRGGDGPPRRRIWREFAVADADLVVEKTAASAFFPGHSPLPDLLAANGVDTVLITGTLTNVCCESSARDASTLGYRVVMVADANAARRDADHNAALYTIYRTFGDVRTTDEVLELLDRPAAAHRVAGVQAWRADAAALGAAVQPVGQ